MAEQPDTTNPTTTNPDDEHLVAVWDEFERLSADAKRETEEEAFNRAVNKAFQHLGKMTTIPSESLTGILMKLRAAWRDIGWLDSTPIEELSLSEQLLYSAMEDGERLAGRAAS